MNILLDTCSFLWFVFDEPKYSKKALSLFLDPLNLIFLSSVSAWEISTKHALGKLALKQSPEVFIPAQRRMNDIRELPFDEASALRGNELPRMHRDPFDRMLVCQAMVYDMVILTPDHKIGEYPVRTEW